MPRVPYCRTGALTSAQQDVFDRYERIRGKPASNLYCALAHAPDILDARHTYSNSLRYDIKVDQKYRELAVMMVGWLTEAEYEFLHHWNSALEAGVRSEQLHALEDFETSPEFDETERAVLRYTQEATLKIKVSVDTWAAFEAAFDHRELVELVLIVAWYNQTVRVLIPLCVDIEESGAHLRELLPKNWELPRRGVRLA